MIRSGYSFRTAFGHLPEVISRIQEIGLPAAPLADRNSTFGFAKWTKLCKQEDIAPVYGVEIAVFEKESDGKQVADFWTFLALEDLEPLHRLLSDATLASNGKEIGVPYKVAMKIKGVIKIAGPSVRLEAIAEFKDDPNLFIGLTPSTPKALFVEAKKAGFKFWAKPDNVYPREEDFDTWRVMLGRYRSGSQTYPQHIVSDAELASTLDYMATASDIRAAVKNRTTGLLRCRAAIRRAELLVPEKPLLLEELCRAGAKKLGVNLEDEVYKARLHRELKLIYDKKFEDYFHIIADIIAEAKKHMMVGPARGSSAGSLVCYLLGITSVDPIPYGLIFERFIDINRSDLPDIDIDFSEKRRDLVFGYVKKKYGEHRVARIGTVTTFKPKSALNQIGKALRIPSWEIDKVAEVVIERQPGDARADQALEDTFAETVVGRKFIEKFPEAKIVTRFEGHPNNSGQHAAGIVITNEDVTRFVGVDWRSSNNGSTDSDDNKSLRAMSVMCDKYDAEAFNLLKIDALGLSQESTFERISHLIGKPKISGWMEKDIPLDDPLAFKVLNEGKFAGIFQFAGQAVKSLTQSVKVESLNDMVAITSLARPGPLSAGGAHQWARRRMGLEAVEYITPMLEELTKDTYGVVVYQEQIMNIVRQIGGMSWEETSIVRKGISQSKGKEFFAQFFEKFLAGAKANGIEEFAAQSIWDTMKGFGSYAFNKSHAVSYSIISYQCCWLKAYYPVEFAAATLDSEPDPQKQIYLLRELQDEGVDYVPVDINNSTANWEVKKETIKRGKKETIKRTLIGPLTNIKGIGPVTLHEVMEARRTQQPLKARTQKLLEGIETEIDTLYPVADTIKKLHPDLKAINIASIPTPIIRVQCEKTKYNTMIFAVLKKMNVIDENEPDRIKRRLASPYARPGDTGVIMGPTRALNLHFADDTDEIFAKVNRQDMIKFGPLFENDHVKVGNSLFAIKGQVPSGFRMISIEAVKYLGEKKTEKEK